MPYLHITTVLLCVTSSSCSTHTQKAAQLRLQPIQSGGAILKIPLNGGEAEVYRIDFEATGVANAHLRIYAIRERQVEFTCDVAATVGTQDRREGSIYIVMPELATEQQVCGSVVGAIVTRDLQVQDSFDGFVVCESLDLDIVKVLSEAITIREGQEFPVIGLAWCGRRRADAPRTLDEILNRPTPLDSWTKEDIVNRATAASDSVSLLVTVTVTP